MDRKTIILIVASLGLLFAFQWGVNKFFPPVALPKSTNAVSYATNGTGTNLIIITNAPLPVMTAAIPTTNAPIVLATNLAEQVEVIETREAIYTFTSHGGGLKQIQLKSYPETVGCDLVRGTNHLLATLNDHARVPVLAMQADTALGDNEFTLRRGDGGSLTAEKTMPSGLRVVKQFDLGSNYQLTARVRMENTSAQPLTLPAQQLSIGTATPMGPRDPMTMMGVFWFGGNKAEHVEQSWFDGGASCFSRTPRTEYSSGTNAVLWAAVHNQFFAIVVVPGTNAVAGQFTTHRIDLPAPTAQELAVDSKMTRTPHGLEGALTYGAITLAGNQSLERIYTIYAGPKQEKLLSSVGRHTGEIMDFGFFSLISKFMLRLMNFLHGLVAPIVPHALGDYAVALILMTVIIKLIFWPLTKASTRSMKRMQALSPEMKKIQEKYKDDPMKMNKKVMEFWREHKVNPMSGCWPMLVQLPIFFALFRMIPNAIELRGTPFLWACDLSKPDTVFIIPGIFFAINPLPIIMGVTMLWQARLQPPSPGMDPAQQKIMKYMPLMFLVFLYNQPAGLTLYWTVQNLLTIAQTKLTKTEDAKGTVTVVSSVAPKSAAPKKKK